MADEEEPDDVTVTGTRTPREERGGGFGGSRSASPGEMRGSGASSLTGRSSSIGSPWLDPDHVLGLPAVPADIGLTPPHTLPEVVVEAERVYTTPGDLSVVDPGGKFHVDLGPRGDLVVGAPFSLPQDPYGIQPPIRRDVLERLARESRMPMPEPLPEVKVEAKRPPARPLTPSIFVFGSAFARAVRALNPLLFLGLFQQAANVGEDRRVREAHLRRIALNLAPIIPSVDRLADPLPVVTVRSSRISNRATSRTPASLVGGTLRGPAFRRVPAPFVSTPTAFTLPTPRPLRSRNPAVSAIVEPLRTIVGAPPSPFAGLVPRAPTTRTPAPSPAPPRVVPSPPRMPGVPIVNPPLVGLPPLTGFNPIGVPSLLTQPLAQRVGGGRCVCPKPTKEKPRKRVPRVECWRGTYVETASGLIKSRKEKVPCQ